MAALNALEGTLNSSIAEYEDAIPSLTTRQSSTAASALTISSAIATEEANIRLETARSKLTSYQTEKESLLTTIKSIRVQIKLTGDQNTKDQKQAEIDRINGVIESLDVRIGQQDQVLLDIDEAKTQAKATAGLSDDLALGTAESIQRVVDNAPGVIELI